MASSKISFADLSAGVRFFCSLPSYLRRPLTPHGAKAALAQRLENRATDFLNLVRRAIFENPDSPYRLLMEFAGCEYLDLEKLVQREGLECALETLLENGVYLSVDEMKGRCAVRRGSRTIVQVEPHRLINPYSSFHARATSGSGNTAVYLDLESIRENALNEYLACRAHGGDNLALAIWQVPGSAAMRILLRYGLFGGPAPLWFSQVDPGEVHSSYGWSCHIMRWGSLLAGVSLPYPIYIAIDEPMPIIEWMAETRRAGFTPYLCTFPSSAVRLCEQAASASIDLSGVIFMLCGEPITETRMAVVRTTNARAVTSYATIEAGGRIANGCLFPEMADDCHFYADLHGLVRFENRNLEMNMPSSALLISSIRPLAPMVLLNASTGDEAVITDRPCGCPLETLGWRTHIHSIRSYEKLTVGGMTFFDTDLIHVLEHVLPACFGGGPADYQLVEHEDSKGNPHLKIRMHPSIPSAAAQAVVEKFIESVGQGSNGAKVMTLLWKSANFIEIERRAPSQSASGKIQHLQIDRKRAPAT